METKNKPLFKSDSQLKLIDQVRRVLRYRHYAYRTERTCWDWIVRFVKFHVAKIHPSQMGKSHSLFNHLAELVSVIDILFAVMLQSSIPNIMPRTSKIGAAEASHRIVIAELSTAKFS